MNPGRSIEKRLLKWRLRLFDSSSLALDETMLGNKTRRYSDKSLHEDRLQELMDYYEVTEAELRESQTPESAKEKNSVFDGDLSSDKTLLDCYRETRFSSNTRHMLAYTRFSPAAKLLYYLNGRYLPSKRKNIRVLDYGCGVSDYGLAFAVHGYPVVISDIAGGNLDFARWRYSVRNIPASIIPIHEEDMYPDLGQASIIISGEVFEHVRDPLQLLKNMHKALPKAGLLWHSGYPEDVREIGGAHLPEAGEARAEALAFIHQHFKPATKLYLPGYLYRKS